MVNRNFKTKARESNRNFDGTEKSIDFDTDVHMYKIKQKRGHSDLDETNNWRKTQKYLTEECNKIIEAKRKEINNWKNQQVFIKVDEIGQKCLSTKWVLTMKVLDGKPTTKAPLVLGYSWRYKIFELILLVVPK